MPKLSWSAFIERRPAAHLVAGVIPEEDVATVTVRDSLALLAKLAKRLALTGQYAMTVDRRSGLPEIHCAFARDTDAAGFAQALNATGVGRYSGWESQRQFGLDSKALKTIAKVLEWIEP
jgi:hypothetical protein